MTWVVGKRASVVRRWRKTSTGESTTGTATVVVWRFTSSGSLEYLQSDLSTWDVTPYNHSMAYVSGIGWRFTFTVPSSAANSTVYATATHSDTAYNPKTEDHWVTSMYAFNFVGFALNGTV